mgnify:CR=1 FL=1
MGLLNTNNYPKGAWVLHSLRGLIGDSAFFAGIRDYYKTYRDSTAPLEPVRRGDGSGGRGTSLTWYFTQALTQPGLSDSRPPVEAPRESPGSCDYPEAEGLLGTLQPCPISKSPWTARSTR